MTPPPNRQTDQIAAHHTLLVYEQDEEFVALAEAYLSSVGADGEIGYVIVPPAKRAQLEMAVGTADRVQFLHVDSVYSRPEATIAYYDDLIRRHERRGDRVMRVIADLPAWKPGPERDAWIRYEALLNRVFLNRPVSLICGYDRRKQHSSTLEAVWRTHPTVLDDDWQDNPSYEVPERVIESVLPEPDPLPELEELDVGVDDATLLENLRCGLRELRVRGARAKRIQQAAVELSENARRHGGAPRSQRLGRVGRHVVWELTDAGPGFADPCAGYIPPSGDQASERGLWTVRQLVDRLEFLSCSRGFTARIWL
jgi:anti-sigma regulatory factor (Ser/Thr protein kinase)